MSDVSVNLYAKMYKEETRVRTHSGKTKEEREEVYKDTKYRMKALKALSKWSPISTMKKTEDTLEVCISNVETGEARSEFFTGLNLEQVIEVGAILTDIMARDTEDTFDWYIKGYTEMTPSRSRTYCKDSYEYTIKVRGVEEKGIVRSYTITKAIQLVTQLLKDKNAQGKELYNFEVVNPYTNKKVTV